jgi:hypothetical protein
MVVASYLNYPKQLLACALQYRYLNNIISSHDALLDVTAALAALWPMQEKLSSRNTHMDSYDLNVICGALQPVTRGEASCACVPQRDSIGLHNEGGRKGTFYPALLACMRLPLPIPSLQKRCADAHSVASVVVIGPPGVR